MKDDERAARTFGIIGLGKMGAALALQALEKGWRVAGFTLGGPSSELIDAGVMPATSIIELKDLLPRPRKVLLYVPAGPAVDKLLAELALQLEPGDIIADGGNSYWATQSLGIGTCGAGGSISSISARAAVSEVRATAPVSWPVAITSRSLSSRHC